MHENWILARAFQELLRAVRHALEEAHTSISLVAAVHRVKSSAALQAILEPFKKKSAALKFPVLLAAVNRAFSTNLVFSDAYLSLQTARNCLEHRNGIVGPKETKGADTFTLSVPRLKLFYMRNGAEIELAAGSVVEGDEGNSNGVDILMKVEERARQIALGERIIFSLTDFNEIAFACFFMGQQLSKNLAALAPKNGNSNQ
jgi:hypothetical protein